jgi:hypothetical protein
MDKDKIAGWRGSLDRTLHVFNVSTVLISACMNLYHIPFSQTELTLSTNVIVGQTHDEVVEVNSRVKDLQGDVKEVKEVGINPLSTLPY